LGAVGMYWGINKSAENNLQFKLIFLGGYGPTTLVLPITSHNHCSEPVSIMYSQLSRYQEKMIPPYSAQYTSGPNTTRVFRTQWATAASPDRVSPS